MAELQDSPGGLINQFAVRPEIEDPPPELDPEAEQEKKHRLPGAHRPKK